MIRINLLPVRAEKKKESIRQQISIGILIIILALSVMAYLQISLSREVEAVREELARTESEINKYRRLMKEVREFRKKKKVLERKIAIIEELERLKEGPLLLLDELSRIIPESAWLENLKQRDGNIEVKGIAADNETIAEFMRRLEASPHFERVELVVTRKVERAGYNLKSFGLTFSWTTKASDGKGP